MSLSQKMKPPVTVAGLFLTATGFCGRKEQPEILSGTGLMNIIQKDQEKDYYVRFYKNSI